MRQYRTIFIVVLACMLLACCFACRKSDAASNGDASGAFDFTKETAGLPSGWTVNSYESRYATSLENGEFGLSSAVMDDCRLCRTVAVEPETRYVLTAELRTENVTGGQGATLSVDNYADDGSYIYSDGLFGTNDWTPVTLAFRTAKSQKAVTLALRLGGYSSVSSGSVWFRNVCFAASDNAPVPFQNLTPTEQEADADERTQEDYENLFTVIFWAGVIAAIVLLFGVLPKGRELNSATDRVAHQYPVFLLLVLIGLVIRFVLCAKFKGHSTDIGCWQGWGAKVATQGPRAFYVDNWCDYPPGYMLVCAVLYRIAGVFSDGPEALRLFVYMVPAFLCDVGSGLLLLRSAKRFSLGDRLALLLAGLIVLNPAAVFLSGAWGQIDSILTLLLLGTFMLLNASREKPWYRLLAGLLYGVAILMKWQALIFGPVLALMYLMTGVDQFGTKRFIAHVLWSVAAVLGAVLVLLGGSLLFRGEGMPLTWMVDRFLSASGGYDYASIEAYNFHTLLGGNWAKANGDLFTGASVGGMLLACNRAFSKVALLIGFPTLILRAWNAMRTRKDGEPNEPLWHLIVTSVISALLAMLYFALEKLGETTQGPLSAIAGFPLYGVLMLALFGYLAHHERGKRSLVAWLSEGGVTAIGTLTLFAAVVLFGLAFVLGAAFKLFGGTLTFKTFGVIGIALASVLTVALFAIYWKKHRAANYSLYTNRGLIFTLSACFIVWVFTCGHYMHERYIFPALFLLVFAYAYDRDPHKLAVFCLLTVTTFMNEMVAMYVVSDGAIDLIRGGAIHNRLIALISLVEVVAALYLTVTSFRKAIVFDPGDPREDRNGIAAKKQDRRAA